MLTSRISIFHLAIVTMFVALNMEATGQSNPRRLAESVTTDQQQKQKRKAEKSKLTITKEGSKSNTMDDVKVEGTNPASLEVTLEPEGVSALKEEGHISLRPEVFVQGRFSFSPVRSAEPASAIEFRLTRLEVGWSGRLTKHVSMGFELKVHNAVMVSPEQC